MGASVVLNILIGEGRFAKLSNRLRHWGVPVQSKTTGGVSQKDDVVLK
jgi:hypothetical protein